jgi:hypothetical protein
VSISERSVFQKPEGFALTDIPDGLAITDADGRAVHFLNPVASAIFLLCDGNNDIRSIATILKEEYGLPDAPVKDVSDCQAELAASDMIRKVG